MTAKTILLMTILLPFVASAQTPSEPQPESKKEHKEKRVQRGIGIKAGVNFANVRNTQSINTSNQTGFMAGAFLAPPSKGLMGYRAEIIYSKQGYNYSTQSKTGSVLLDYIIMPHLTTINLTKFVQLQLGGQVAYLLSAKSDSSKVSSSNNPYGAAFGTMDMYNRFDYGLGAGVELHPVSGLMIGVRMNFSLANVYKDPSSFMTNPSQSPIPKIEAKNNVLQLSAGWIF